MAGYYGNVAAHDFHFGQVEGEGAAVPFAQNEPFRTDTDGNRLVRDVLTGFRSGAVCCSDIKQTVAADVQTALFDAAAEYVNRRCAQEPGYKQVRRIIVNILRLSDLLNDTSFHNHN